MSGIANEQKPFALLRRKRCCDAYQASSNTFEFQCRNIKIKIIKIAIKENESESERVHNAVVQKITIKITEFVTK